MVSYISDQDVRLQCASSARRCEIQARAYRYWLDILTPLKWGVVGGSALLSALAGATVLGQPGFFGTHWDVVGGVLALVAAALTALHAAFGCDAHQAECHRLIQVFAGLEAAFQAAPITDSDLSAAVGRLERKYQETIEHAKAAPPQWCRQKAQASFTHI